MTANDVANAVLSQNLDAPAGQVGQPPASRTQSLQLPIRHAGPTGDARGDSGDIAHQDRSRTATAAGQRYCPIVIVITSSSSGSYGLPTPPGAQSAAPTRK